jgi:sialic acid synthase SpsE
MELKISKRIISKNSKTYFIADIAANHDGSLKKAKELIYEAKAAGADAAKFQHFSAETIVSDFGFKSLKSKLSHQSKWKKSVYEVYKDASIDLSWTPILKEECDKVGIDFFTSPYAFNMVDHIDPYVPAYKIGSGDITWHEILKYIAKKNKPIILATGASNLNEVEMAVKVLKKNNKQICLMQCNTNYTNSDENFNFINLNVLKLYKIKFPEVILGLSDHTSGHSTVLGAIALGAKMIEKHFTLNNYLEGPDHKFSMNPKTWKEMINSARELEKSLGNGKKKIENNELQTAVVQRRAIRASENILKGTIIKKKYLSFLRPCPKNALPPYNAKNLLGKEVKKKIKKGDIIRLKDVKKS